MPETPIRLEAWGLSLETMIRPDIRRPMFSIKPANDTDEFYKCLERIKETLIAKDCGMTYREARSRIMYDAIIESRHLPKTAQPDHLGR